MLVDYVILRCANPDEEEFLPPASLLQRVADRFPLALIDGNRADRWVHAAADEMATLGGLRAIPKEVPQAPSQTIPFPKPQQIPPPPAA